MSDVRDRIVLHNGIKSSHLMWINNFLLVYSVNADVFFPIGTCCGSVTVSHTYLSVSHNGAHRTLRRTLKAWMFMDLALVMPKLRVCDRAYISFLRIFRRRMARRQDARHRADDGADGLVHGLLFRPTDDFGQGGAVVGVGEVLRIVKDARVLGEVMVVVGGGISHRADLTGLVDVKVGMFGWEDCVCCSHDGADFSSGHDV